MAASIYVIVAIISTILSTSFYISVWGEVSGQFGYSAYTIVSYFLLFAMVATNLKTRAQLWRLLGVIVATGVLVAAYAIVQHYDLDPLDLGETGSIRVASTMANSVFAGSLLVGTTVFTLGVGVMLLDRLGWSPLRVALWVALIATQLLAVYWTGARGSWLLGVPSGLAAFLVIPPIMQFFSTWVRPKVSSFERRGELPLDLIALLGLQIALVAMVVVGQLGRLGLADLPGVPDLRVLLGLLGLLGFLSILVLLSGDQFSSGVRSYAKSFLVLGSALLVTLIVAVHTFAPGGSKELDFLDSATLPDLRIMLGSIGFLGLVGLAILASRSRFGSGLLDFGRLLVVLSSALVITLFAAGLTTPSSGVAGGGDALGEAQQPTERGFSFRIDIWGGSLDLVRKRPWFEYEELTLSPVRHLVGYGPELFKYTFPLESPLGGLLSQAHNFFIHHWVEQGALGFFSSLGLFVAFFAVGGVQLLRNWETYSTTHKWILITLLATMVGRLAEMLVGVNRESDLVLFWLLLAIMVVLPSVMSSSEEVGHAPVAEEPSRPLTRRERRRGRRDRGALRADGRSSYNLFGGQMSFLQGAVLGLVSVLVIFIGWLTWDKNVDYAWAAAIAASARDRFQDWELQDSERLMSKAIDKAPDVPIYYHNLAGIYDAYREFARNNPDRELPPCSVFFSLEPSVNSAQQGRPYFECSEKAYLGNLAAFGKNRNSPQNKLVLANSTMQLALNGDEAKGDEAIRYYRELTDVIPSSWPLHNALGTSYLRLGQPGEALVPFERSLELTQGSSESAQIHYLIGVANRRLNETQKAIDSFEQSLAVSSDGPNAGEVRRQLVNALNGPSAISRTTPRSWRWSHLKGLWT